MVANLPLGATSHATGGHLDGRMCLNHFGKLGLFQQSQQPAINSQEESRVKLAPTEVVRRARLQICQSCF